MGALFVRSRRGRGGTRKQLGSHSKEFEQRSAARAGRGRAAAEGAAGRQPTALTPGRGRGAGRPGLGDGGLRTAAAGRHGVPPVGDEGSGGPGSGRGRVRLPKEAAPERHPQVPALSGRGARRPQGFHGPPTPRQVPPLCLPASAPHPGRGPYLELREQDLPPFGVGRHCTPLWTPHLDATAARKGRRRDGTGEGG